MILFFKKTALVAILICTMALTGIAQPPPPPGHGEEDDQSAPIGSGMIILLVLAGAYGAKKVYAATGSKTPREPSA